MEPSYWSIPTVHAILGSFVLFWVLLTMVLILALAAVVAVYAAYTHRGESIPAVPWVGDALEKAVAAVPTLPGDQPGEYR